MLVSDEVHISACLLPFTLNGTMYRESCAVAYECSIGRCNFAMCPALFQPTIDSQPQTEWVICYPFRAREFRSAERKTLSNGNVAFQFLIKKTSKINLQLKKNNFPELPSISNVRDIWCLNSTFVIKSTQLLPSKWILVQSRSNGSDFDKSWEDYKAGFGVESHDYWIGNEAFHLLTSMNCSQIFEGDAPFCDSNF